MAAHDRSGTSKESLSGLPRHSAGEDGGSSGAANGHHGHHGHHEVPTPPHPLVDMGATLIFFFIYFFFTIPLKAPDYPSSSDAGSGRCRVEQQCRRPTLAASETM